MRRAQDPLGNLYLHLKYPIVVIVGLYELVVKYVCVVLFSFFFISFKILPMLIILRFGLA